MKRTLLFILFLEILFSYNVIIAQPSEPFFTNADEMPFFAGCKSKKGKRACSNQALVQFISDNLVYPESAKETRIEGTVYVSFIIDQSGALTESNIIRDIGGGCGEAALQVLASMPKWEPGIKDGEPVNIKLNLPIHFALTSGNNNKNDLYKIQWGQIRTPQITNDELTRNLKEKIIVRDEFGNTLALSNLTFSYERNKFFIEARSNGEINERMQKVIKKAKRGGLFVVSATIQDKGNFIDVDQEFEIIK